jgi:hypothetical protein
MGVTPHASVDSFFYELVVGALQQQKVEASQSAEYYLVGLLGEFTTSPITDQPLALVLAQAKDPSERVRALKEVGDTSLYVSGFFPASFERKIVQPEYYRSMGEAAYRELSHRLRTSSLAEIYDELSAKFPRFVDVLCTVRERIELWGADVTKLYETWLATRSEWIEARLRSLGVLVRGPDDGSAIH